MTVVSLAIVLLVLLRCLVPVTANLYWESDPRLVAGGLAGQEPALMYFGPAAVAWLDALSLLAAAAAMGLHVLAGGTVRWRSVALAAIGAAFAAAPMPRHVDNIFLGGGWIGAVCLALAVSHLAQRPAIRRWFAAAIVALAVPLAIAATRWVFLDQPLTRQNFLEHESEFLAARQWERGSPEHLIFVRRMETPEAIGAFSFSNVLGSVAAATAALAAMWAWGMAAAGRYRRCVLPAALALVAMWTMAMTRSKGAAVAAMLVAGLFFAVLLLRRRATSMRWLAHAGLPHAGLALVGLAVVAVLLRGAAGPPETVEGERSLLFRWHYWQAAARIVASSPGHALFGAGPTALQDEYSWAKNPLNPEEIRSTHNVFLDLIAMIGVGGWAWSALLIVWLWRAGREAAAAWGRPAGDADQGLPQSPQGGGKSVLQALTVATPDVIGAAVLTTILFGVEVVVRWAHVYDQATFLMWAGGAMAFLGALCILVTRGWWSAAFTQVGLFAAAVVLLVHNQIEMTFHQPSSAPLAWLVMGLAAAAPAQRDGAESPALKVGSTGGAGRWLSFVPALGLLLAALVYMAAAAGPLTREQDKLRQAAAALRSDPRSAAGVEQAIQLLSEAERIMPNDPRPPEWQARMAMQLASSRLQQLRQMDGAPPQARAQVREMIRHHALMSLAAFDRLGERGLLSHSIRRQHAQILEHAADLLGEPDYLNRALQHWHQLAADRPHVWQDRRDLGDLLWKMDRQEEATQHYQRAIELSDQQYLDPLRQMGKKDRTLIESRLPG